MSYLVNEIFYTLQGEGYWTGRPAVFCRFSRCNLACEWCDTDFAHADRLTLDDLLGQIAVRWPTGFPSNEAMVVFTGGEPALQLDADLVLGVKEMGFYMAIETNGTRPLSRGIDWICVSPKAGARLEVTSGDELKVVWPQPDINPEQLRGLNFKHFWLSPMDGPELSRNTDLCVEFVKADPRWRLNIQTHKVIGVR